LQKFPESETRLIFNIVEIIVIAINSEAATFYKLQISEKNPLDPYPNYRQNLINCFHPKAYLFYKIREKSSVTYRADEPNKPR